MLRPGDWPDSLTEALATLGCRLVDTSLWGDRALPHALASYVQPPTAAGVLGALAAAQAALQSAGVPNSAAASSRTASTDSSANAGRGGWRAALARMSPGGRRQLRAFLLQPKWCDARLGAERLQLLCSLPIFEVHPDELAHQQRQRQQQRRRAVSAMAASAGAAASAAPPDLLACFAALSGSGPSQQQQPQGQQPPQDELWLAPACVPSPQLLGGCFLRSDSEGEAQLLSSVLGVRTYPLRELLSEHAAPRAQLLQQHGALVPLLAAVLRQLPELAAADEQLVPTLARLALVPTRGGGLAAARQLADPRDPRLAAIMDPARHFPAPPLDGELTQWGMGLLGSGCGQHARLGFRALCFSPACVRLCRLCLLRPTHTPSHPHPPIFSGPCAAVWTAVPGHGTTAQPGCLPGSRPRARSLCRRQCTPAAWRRAGSHGRGGPGRRWACGSAAEGARCGAAAQQAAALHSGCDCTRRG